VIAAAQDSFWDRIQGVRNEELSILWSSALVSSVYAFLLNTIPVIVSVVTFTAYVLLGNELTAAKAFTSLSLFTVPPLPPPGRHPLRPSYIVHESDHVAAVSVSRGAAAVSVSRELLLCPVFDCKVVVD
jgi:hypothetical protein